MTIGGVDFATVTFAQPMFLWLLVAPAILLVFAVWAVRVRWADVRLSTTARRLPVRARFSRIGELGFWLCALAASSLCILALARPQARTSLVHRAGADFIVLQDASASMYAQDIAPDRWRRSIQFIRAFGEALSWKDDRMALALFAHRASPQMRLTNDPNALFFFLDHLGEHSPFRLEDDPTWDTNIDEGLHWGLHLVDTDEELFGVKKNVKAFIVISDGQAWSGEVAESLAEARQRKALVFVVGVGTTSGAIIPGTLPGETEPTIRAILDREALRSIARVGGGDYFEVGRNSDREMASTIIAAVKRRATVVQDVESHTELYWYCLLGAAIFLWMGVSLLRDPTELWSHLGITILLLWLLMSMSR